MKRRSKQNVTARVMYKLENKPACRERKNMHKMVASMVIDDNPQLFEGFDRMYLIEKVAEISKFSDSSLTAWRHILQKKENAHLRGSDYEEKTKVEKQKQRELGYNV